MERLTLLHHYITQYREGGKRFAEAWLQIDLFGRCFCFSRRRIEISPGAKSSFAVPLAGGTAKKSRSK